MTPDDADAEELLARAGRGDAAAQEELLGRHGERLRKMVAVRLDRRLAARIDPSDVVQEALLDASRMLPAYLERPLPFYPWLRRLAWKRLVKLQQRHLGAQRRLLPQTASKHRRHVHDHRRMIFPDCPVSICSNAF